MIKSILVPLFTIIPTLLYALTLDEARVAARQNYPLIKDYALIELTEKYTVENASKAWLPQVSAGAQVTWQNNVASYPEVLTQMLESQGVNIRGLGKLQYKASVDVSQTIWDGGRVNANQDIASANARESEAANDVELYQLRSRIDNLYFGILLLELQHETLLNTLELLNTNLQMMNTLVRNGAAMQSDADAVEAELLTTQQMALSVESTEKSYRDVLGFYIGSNEYLTLQMPDEIILQSSDDFTKRPEQKLFDTRLNLLDAQKNLIQASLRPTMGAFAQGYYGYPGMNFMEAMKSRTPGFNAIIGMSVKWDLGNFYTKKNKLADIEANKQRIDIARKTFDFNSSIQTTQLRQEISRLHQLCESDAEIVDLRQRVRNAAETRLREGVVESIALLQRITEENNAKITAKTHQIEYLKALYSLQTSMNQ